MILTYCCTKEHLLPFNSSFYIVQKLTFALPHHTRWATFLYLALLLLHVWDLKIFINFIFGDEQAIHYTIPPFHQRGLSTPQQAL